MMIFIDRRFGVRLRQAWEPCDYGLIPASIDESQYACGYSKPNYSMPAIRCPTFNSLYELGYVSAMNDFDIASVLRLLKL